MKVPAAVADVLVAGAVAVHAIGRLFQRHHRQAQIALLRVVGRGRRPLARHLIAICNEDENGLERIKIEHRDFSRTLVVNSIIPVFYSVLILPITRP